jgi:signal transduction histidine kinase
LDFWKLAERGAEANVDVRITSQDVGFCRLCQDILTEYCGQKWKLNSGESPADLYIGEVNAESDIPGNWDIASRYLFLVPRRDVRKYQESLARPEATVLLKPITRATLSAFLGIALSAQADRASNASLRADRDEILQCLIQANLKLQEYDQNRTNFLSRAMHDFRVPLTAINGYCGLLLSEAMGSLEEKQVDVLRKMRQSSHRLSRMAEAMYQLSMDGQATSGVSLRKENIRTCIEQCIHEVAPAAATKQISISLHLDPPTAELYLERTLIEQALINFLDNACKFTSKAGLITIQGGPVFWERRSKVSNIAPITERRRQTSDEPNGYRVDISNSGRAIPMEHLDEIFEEYASYSGGQDRSGGGLGLAICRMIIAQHEGRVWAENTDKGPQFSFIIPIKPKSLTISSGPQLINVKEDFQEVTQ